MGDGARGWWRQRYLTGKTTVPADSLTMDGGGALIRELDPGEIVRRTTAEAEYGMARPAAVRRYGANDARVNASIARVDSTIRAGGGSFEHQIFPGTGHGFLRQQLGASGANLAASRAAWPRTISFFRTHLGQ